MRAEPINRISFIGAGNVASHLALSFKKAGFSITDVWSESVKSAKILAGKVNANWCNKAEELTSNYDLLVIAIPDQLIEEVARSLTIADNQMLVHTSGPVPLKALTPFAENCGVFYPLQTFSRDRDIEFKTIPILVEANSIHTLNMLSDVAARISNKVMPINSEKRKYIHLAAVFVNNFPNLMYRIDSDILKQEDLDFDLLRPLILETARKVQEFGPDDVQTGPAMRNDRRVIDEQICLLKTNRDYQEVYKMLSELIPEKREPKREKREAKNKKRKAKRNI